MTKLDDICSDCKGQLNWFPTSICNNINHWRSCSFELDRKIEILKKKQLTQLTWIREIIGKCKNEIIIRKINRWIND